MKMTILVEKIIATILSVVMALSSGSAALVPVKGDIAAGAAVTASQDHDEARRVFAESDGNYISTEGLELDASYPTIVIHGIGQAETYLTDGSGEHVVDDSGNEVTGWPIYFNVKKLVAKLALPLLRTLITQKDNGFCDILSEAIEDNFKTGGYNDDGTPRAIYETENFGGRPVSECTQEEKDLIYHHIPLQAYSNIAGEENLYYFTYDSFGDTYKIVEDLEKIIAKAKADTGKDKINLVPVSLGGAIATAYIDEHKDGSDINKVAFIVPALDGSEIIGKIMANELDYSDEGLYRNIFTKLVGVDEFTGWMLNIVVRTLPKQEYKDILSTLAKSLSNSMLSRCMTMWGLVPTSMYEELEDEYLTEGTVLKARADKFLQARNNLFENLKNYEKNGIEVYDICGYGLQLYSLIDSESNSDKIIHSSSTSMGATFSRYDSTLDDDYKQQYYTEYNMISPDRRVDASTCAFPMRTWFFGDQDHEKIARNDVVIRLATTILLCKDMDINSTPAFPQFNGHRNTRIIKSNLQTALNIATSTLSGEDAQRLNTAIDDSIALLKETIIDEQKTDRVEKEMDDVLVSLGINEKDNEFVDNALTFVFRGISEFLYQYYGPRGFSDRLTVIG